jgi:predicted O-linked N-acetylglucosamine transferase (SPINDLY family)
MGVLCRQNGRLKEAIVWFQKALKQDRAHLASYINFGRTYADLGDHEAAVRTFREVLKRQPRHAEALANLSWSTHKLGNSKQALTIAEQALAIDPRLAAALSNRAGILFELGRYSEALPEAERAVAINPSDDHALNVYATILSRLGRTDDAIAIFQRLLASKPGDIGALMGLGNSYFASDNLPKANEAFRQAVARSPDDVYVAARLCRSLLDSRYDDEGAHAREANALAHRTVDLGKPLGGGFSELQAVFQRTADFDGQRKLGAPWPLLDQTPSMHISVLHNQLSQVDTPADRRVLLDLHRRWGNRIIDSTKAAPIAAPALLPSRAKLRIGLISSDLRQHAIAYFALPLIQHYDHTSVELYCYSFYPGEADPVQQLVAGAVDSFKLLLNATNQQVAQTIANDGLDILFELGGSTKHNRLEVMGYRMAPAQASWLGYPHSAGLATIDYILVDPYIKPRDAALLIEKPFEVPESWVSFRGLGFPEVPIAETPPVDRNGGAITFGTMNSPYKFSSRCIALWSRVLQRVENSRFLMVRPEASSELFRGNVAREFARNGIATDRLAFTFNTRGQHLSFYNEIDISLDALPQTGGTTTCETVWMGVPAVTLVGETFFERLSYSNLTNAGLGDLCATTEEDYVALAAGLARDLPRLRALRRGLRDKVKQSPLGEIERWVRNFEATARSVLR